MLCRADTAEVTLRHTEAVRHAIRVRARTTTLLATLALPVLTLAACSSTPTHPTSTTQPSTSRTSSTPTAPPTTSTTTLPTSGPLTGGAPISIPLALAGTQVLATEGPGGAVFVAAQAPDSPAPSVVWVVDGNGPAAIAEHISSGVAALAADATNLYVATYQTVTAYDRTTGNESAQWTLPLINTANSSDADLVSMTAAAGRVDVSITQGDGISVLAINPDSPAAPAVVVQAINGVVVGSDGTIYYEASSQRLTSRSPSGDTKTGIALTNSPNGLGGGVQYVNFVAGGVIWVGEPAGQGLDAQWTTYSTSTLAQVGQFNSTAGNTYVDTAAGPLALSIPEVSTCPQQGSPPAAVWCVARVTPQGALSDQYALSSNGAVLVGPDPVAIETGTSTLTLIRLT
jgi:hypothetical protein